MSRQHHARPHPRTTRSALLFDTATILGAAVLAVVASQVLPTGASAPSPASSALPDGSGSAIESAGGNAPSLPGLETLGPVVNPSIRLGASPTPVPFRTLGPKR